MSLYLIVRAVPEALSLLIDINDSLWESGEKTRSMCGRIWRTTALLAGVAGSYLTSTWGNVVLCCCSVSRMVHNDEPACKTLVVQRNVGSCATKVLNRTKYLPSSNIPTECPGLTSSSSPTVIFIVRC